MRDIKIAPGECRRRGLPAIGVRLLVPDGVEIIPAPTEGPIVVTCREPGNGDLTIEIFAAGLLIDRDHVLEAMTTSAAEFATVEPAAGRVRGVQPIVLEGGTGGYMAEVAVSRDERGVATSCPYLWIYVLAPPDLAACGGAIVTVRSVRYEWVAGDAMLSSLRLGALHQPANDAGRAALLPMLHRRR
jgi:hypothetical protein